MRLFVVIPEALLNELKMKSILKGLVAIVALLSVTVSAAQDKNQAGQLKPVFDNYFQLSNALVKTDSKTAAAAANELLSAVKAIKMESLNEAQHTAWMKVMDNLDKDALAISKTQDIKKQRESFKSLSKNTYELIKASGNDLPVFYNHCPMVDANWLSLDKSIKNPYYGSQMLTCGKTVETIK